MTSNLGSHRILQHAGGASSGADYDMMKLSVLDELRQFFRPEFLNRVDETIVFHSLTSEHLEQIVEIQLGQLRRRLAERKIEIELTDAARRHVVSIGSDPTYGARPLKRAIQKEIENPLARKLIAGEIADGQRLRLDYRRGDAGLRVEMQAEEALIVH
jgi:ATP-dependent Clp protease ATP-binding subunit ClpB